MFTIADRADGFGAQLQGFMSGIAWSAYTGEEYIHTPFRTLEVDRAPAPEEFVLRMEKFHGMGLSCRQWSDLTEEEQERCERKQYIDEVHFSQRPSSFYTEAIRLELRRRYESSFFGNEFRNISKERGEQLEIVVHVRRGDVVEAAKDLYTPNYQYIALMTRLIKIYPDARIRIVSEGVPEDFQDIVEAIGVERITFELGGDPRIAFCRMTEAQILVIARSSFSYAAALLNFNTVWAELVVDWWHKPLDHWEVDSEGENL